LFVTWFVRAFRRVHLDPGESQKIRFELKPRDLSMVSEEDKIVSPEGKYSVSIGGGQPNTGAPAAGGRFEVKGTVTLPE
jgi:beta-glucosidase